MSLFAVVRTRSAAWQEGSALEAQPQWDEHARFMNGLETEGLVLLEGPLEGTPDVLLIMRASSPDEIMSALEKDPWTSLGLLRVKEISSWTIRLGSLPERR